MGNTNSSAAQKCLEAAVGGNTALIASRSTVGYQISHVKPYNLDIPVNPAAVTYPQTSDQVAAIVKCAVDNELKVQPRCGGHSYANYGMQSPFPGMYSNSNFLIRLIRNRRRRQRHSRRPQELPAILHEPGHLAGHHRRRHPPRRCNQASPRKRRSRNGPRYLSTGRYRRARNDRWTGTQFAHVGCST